MLKKIFCLVVFTFSLVIISNAQNNSFNKLQEYNQDTVKPRFNFKSQKSLILPIVFVAYGFSSLGKTETRELDFQIRDKIIEKYPNFHTKVDNYLQFFPTAITFALKTAGVESKNNLWSSIKIYTYSTLLMAGTVYTLKNFTAEDRPDDSGINSFPSGHTATAFAAAEFMHEEFKKSSPLLSYSGYLVASATGVLRMLNDKHFFGDVLAGAGIGILTTKVAYWLNNKVFVSHKPKFRSF